MYLHAHSILQHWRDICISTCVYGNKTVVLSLFTCCTKLEQQKKSLVEIEYYIYYKSKETKNMILEWKTLMIIPKSFSLFPYYFIVAIAKGQQNVCANLSILPIDILKVFGRFCVSLQWLFFIKWICSLFCKDPPCYISSQSSCKIMIELLTYITFQLLIAGSFVIK